MGSRHISLFAFTSLAVAAALLAPARAGELSPRELMALAPVLDTSDGGCRSLDVGGWFGWDRALAPKVRFRALYRAPNQFSLLISDAADGTPLVFCSGRKMFLYDPVGPAGPAVYYSEDAGFGLEITVTNTELKQLRLQFYSLLKFSGTRRILVDFRSLMQWRGQPAYALAFEDALVKHNINEFELIRKFQDKPWLTVNIDLTKTCPYTRAAFVRDGVTDLCLDRLTINGALGDEPFAFPTKERLPRSLPVKDVTGDKEIADLPQLAVARAVLVRSVVDRAGRPGPTEIPGLSGVDWDRARANDKKFARALSDLVPPSLRAR